MAGTTKAIPEGFYSLTPYFCVKDAARAIEFYKRAFGATEITRMLGPDGKVMHAELKVGNSIFMLSDEVPHSMCRSPQTLGGTSVGLYLYVDDVDTIFNRAVSAGARTERPVQDMFYGDRSGQIIDPFGHSWGIATHTKDMTAEEIEQAAKQQFSKAAQGQARQQGGS